MRTDLVTALISVVGLTVLVPVGARAVDTMDELAAMAVQANPRMGALDAQISALEAKTAGSRMWMDPMFAIEYSNVPWDTWSLGDSPMSGVQLKLQQTFPFPGKNDRREQVSAAAIEVKRLERDELEVQLAGMVKQHYLDLALVRQLERLTAEHVRVVDGLRERVRLRYEVGRGNQQDVLTLGLLSARLQDELGDFRRREIELTAAINGVLHRDVQTPIPTPTELEAPIPKADVDQLLERAMAERPALAATKQRATALRLDAERVEWERKPDITLWLGYRFRAEAGMDDGTDFLSIGASLPIPFDYGGVTDAQRRTRLENASAVELSRDAQIDEIATGIERALAAWQRAVDKERTYRELMVPEARKTLEASLLAYETDRTDFFSVYRAELDLIQFERTIRTARAAAAKMKVVVEMLIGADPDRTVSKEVE